MRYSYRLLVLALGLGLHWGHAMAVENASQATLPDAGSSAAPAPAVSLKGFRSAVFGTDEAAVRAAITKDFGIAAKDIAKSRNLTDRTDVLTVKVPDIIEGGGLAEIAYVLGYKSHKLIQVTVVWSKATDKDMTTERLLSNGEALRNYFSTAGYVPASIVANAEVKDGILLFRGADSEGKTTALMLHGVKTPATDPKQSAQPFAPDGLLLFYLADPKTPDVFKLPSGQF
jgi:hypothetical protein